MTSCMGSCTLNPFWKGIYSEWKTVPRGAIISFLNNPFQKGGEMFKRVVSPESAPISLKLFVLLLWFAKNNLRNLTCRILVLLRTILSIILILFPLLYTFVDVVWKILTLLII